jgi:hypothetical protein
MNETITTADTKRAEDIIETDQGQTRMSEGDAEITPEKEGETTQETDTEAKEEIAVIVIIGAEIEVQMIETDKETVSRNVKSRRSSIPTSRRRT